MHRSLMLLLIILASAIFPEPAAQAVDEKVRFPDQSPNAGRQGTYRCETPFGGCSYYVCVPSTPGADADWGIHLFFHGQNAQGGAKDFSAWNDQFLNKYGLIGINMCYEDGDNFRETDKKIEAARFAALQTIVDYPVAIGRGVVGCFSGGGNTNGMWCSQYGTKRGPHWPFTFQALYDCNYYSAIPPIPSTGWYVGITSGEWDGYHGMSDVLRSRFSEILSLSNKCGIDVQFRIIRNPGHVLEMESISAASALFGRADLAFAPIFSTRGSPLSLAGIIEMANSGQLAKAASALRKLKPNKIEEINKKSEGMIAKIDARIGKRMKLVSDLAASDSMMALWYGSMFLADVKGTTWEAALKDILINVNKKAAERADSARVDYLTGFRTLFEGGKEPVLTTAGEALLNRMVEACGPDSIYGLGAKSLLTYRRQP